MFSGMEIVTARRVWFVPGFVVWGLPGWGEADFVALEQVGTVNSILYGNANIGESTQQVNFSELTDHRGNQLPASIPGGRVLIRPRSEDPAFITGADSDDKFTVARDPNTAGPVTVDLLVIELGG